VKSIVCEAPGVLSLQDVEDPTLSPGEVLIRIRRVGVCGTDLHAYRGDQPYFKYPRVLGHELSGEIVNSGNSRDLSPGDEVVVVPYLACGRCSACRQGKTNCCMFLEVIGVHRDGGMCELLSMPSSHVLKAEGLSLEQMASVECLSIGAHAVRRAQVIRGEYALVIGAGPIGIGAAQAARNAGAQVIVMDTDEIRLEYCENRLNIPHTVVAVAGVEERLRDLTEGNYPAVVFEATGDPNSMMKAFRWVAHGGRYVLISLVKSDITFNDPEFHKRELSLLSSRNATVPDLEAVIHSMAAGQLETETFVTHRVPFEGTAWAFPQWIRPGAGVIKAMVTL